MEISSVQWALTLTIWNYVFNSVYCRSFSSMCPSIANTNPAKVYDGICYEFINTRRTWHIAQLDCATKGGNLVEIRNSNLHDFIMDALNTLNWKENVFWIGAHNIGGKSSWQWITGNKVTWTNWENGRPFCFSAVLRVLCVEDCAALQFTNGGKWRDFRCSSLDDLYSYICQYPAAMGTTTPSLKNTTVPETHSTTYATATLTMEVTTPTTAGTHRNTDLTIPTNSSGFNMTQSTLINGSTEIGDATKSGITENVTSELTTFIMNIDNSSSTESDFIELETKSSVWESTHIILNYTDIDENWMFNDSIGEPVVGSFQSNASRNALVGPILGSILGICLLSAALLISYYIYRKRFSRFNHSWSVGFDNPNYGAQEESDCHARKNHE